MNAPLPTPPQGPARQRKPDWIRVKAPVSQGYAETRKLMADRVACPTAETRSPLPGASASRQVKAEVREADVTKAVSEMLTAGTRTAAQPKK